MLTNNFRKILNYMFKNKTLVVVDNMVGLDGKIINETNGDSIPLNYLNTSRQTILTSDTSATQGVFIAYGKGTSEATSNNYNLLTKPVCYQTQNPYKLLQEHLS